MTQQSSGTASVGITVMVQGRTPGQFAPVSKTYLINAIKPLNVGKSIAILSILILLGIALFVVITRVINNWLGRFQPAPQDLRIKTFQVAVVEGVDEFTNSLQDISPAKLEPLTVSDLNAGGEARLTRELRHGNLHLYAGSPHGGLGWFKSLDTGNTGYIEDISGAPFMTGGPSTPVSAMASGNRELFPGDAQRSLMLASLWVFSLREIQIGDEDNLGFGGSRMNGVAGEITVFLENGNSASLLPTLLRNALLGISGNLERIITNPDLNSGLKSNSSGIDDYTHQNNTDEPDLI